jgi:hypothetical protein
MFIAALHNSPTIQPAQVPINEWMDKENVVYVRNGVLLSHEEEWNDVVAGKWMELEIMMLSKISQTEQNKYSMFSLVCGI